MGRRDSAVRPGRAGERARNIGRRRRQAGTEHKALGALEQKTNAYAAARDQIAARQAQAAKLPALRQKLKFDQAECTNLVDKIEALQHKAGSGAREGLIHALGGQGARAETSVFLIPADFAGRFEDSGVKNGEKRLVVLNDVAKSIIRKQRGLDSE